MVVVVVWKGEGEPQHRECICQSSSPLAIGPPLFIPPLVVVLALVLQPLVAFPVL